MQRGYGSRTIYGAQNKGNPSVLGHFLTLEVDEMGLWYVSLFPPMDGVSPKFGQKPKF